MDDSSDDDLEIGPQKSAEELLRERERLAEAAATSSTSARRRRRRDAAAGRGKPEAVKPERKPHLAYEDEAMEADDGERSTRPSRGGRNYKERSGCPRRPRPSRPS